MSRTEHEMDQLADPAPADGLPSRFLRSVGMNYVASATSVVASLFVTPVLLRYLGAEAFGVWVLAGGMTGYLELLEFGFGAATTKLIAEDAGKRPQEVSGTLSTSFFVLSGFGLIALVAGGMLALGAPRWFRITGELHTETKIVVALLALTIAASLPGDSFGGALAGHQRYDLRGLSNTLLAVLTALASVAVVLSGGGLVELAVVTAVISIAMHPLRWTLLRRAAPDVRLSRDLVDRRRLRRVGRLSGWFLTGEVAGLLSYRIDLVVVGAALGVKAVAVYAIGAKLARLAGRALLDLSSVFMPHASALSRDGEASRLGDLLVDGTRVAMGVALPLALVLSVLSASVVRAWVGTGYGEAAAVLVILSVFVVTRALVDPLEAVAIGCGLVRPWALAMLGEATVNVVVSIALVNAVGLRGPALGSLVASALVLAPALGLKVCRFMGLGFSQLFRRAILPHALPGVLSTIVLLVGRSLAASGRVELLWVAGAGLLVYALTYYFAGATPAERERLDALVARRRRPPLDARP